MIFFYEDDIIFRSKILLPKISVPIWKTLILAVIIIMALDNNLKVLKIEQ